MNGVAVDYTVQVTDNDGTFYVWARNLDRALQLQAKTGNAFEFNLRNYAIDFDTLDRLPAIKASTQVIRPASDKLLPEPHGRDLVRGISNAVEMVTDGSGYAPMIETQPRSPPQCSVF